MASGALAGPANSTGMTFVLDATRGDTAGVAVGASAQCWFHHHEEHDREHEDQDQDAERAPASSSRAERVALRVICREGAQLRAEVQHSRRPLYVFVGGAALRKIRRDRLPKRRGTVFPEQCRHDADDRASPTVPA